MAEVTWFKVLTDIFADDKIKILQSMPEGDSLLVMWFKVLSQAGKTNDGGYIYLKKNIPYTFGMFATLFGKQQQLVELAMRTFTEFGMIDIDENGYVFVTNWEKHQSIDALEKIKEQDRIRSSNYRERKRLELKANHVTVTLQSQSNHATELELDLELEKEKKKKNKELKEYPADTVELTNHLIDLMLLNNPNVKIPTNLDKWNDDMEKLERIDKYDYMQIRSVIDWCQQDSFWKGNILSAPKLREKIATLLMQMQRPKAGTSGKISSFARLQQMAKEEEQREASGHY
jgi:predicted phage replisome organizer